MKIANPLYLLLFLLLPLLWYLRARLKPAAIRFSSLDLIKPRSGVVKASYSFILSLLRIAAFSLLIIALCRVQSASKPAENITQGIDIILTLDISGSMAAIDFKPQNRLEAAKEEVKRFAEKRTTDRLGLVVFSKEAFTQCPLTFDYTVLTEFLETVEMGLIEDGTAIGTALGMSLKRLKESEAKSKIIILLTDGVNNAGELDPKTGAQMAKAMGVKVYTIGCGKPGDALYPVDDPLFGRRYVKIAQELDEPTLKNIANTTGGKYFRAKDTTSLEEVFNQIDKLEKTELKFDDFTEYNELYGWFLVIALGLILAEIILSNTLFRKIP